MNKQRLNKRKGNSDQDGIAASKNRLVTVPQKTALQPDRVYTRLVYGGIGTMTIATGTSFITQRWQPSAAYDVDPLLLSTATPGFGEWAALYSQYRVTSSNIKVQIVNRSTHAALAVVIPLNADPGTSPAAGDAQAWNGNSYSKTGIVTLAGGPATRLANSMSTEKIFGSKMIYNDDNFMSLTNTVPNNNWYWAVGLFTTGLAPSDLFYDTYVTIEMGVEFFARKSLSI